MAANDQRKLLEQLMAESFEAMPGAAPKPTIEITDPKVCRSFLAGRCPHDLFTNTKSDLGVCPREHHHNLRDKYQSADDAQKRAWGFDFDYFDHLSKLVGHCDQEIQHQEKFLGQTPEERIKEDALHKQISELSETINLALMEVEMLGDEGEVARSVALFTSVRQYKIQKEDKEHELRSLQENSGPSGHQKLQVCQKCAARLSRLDNDRRLADHLVGKMHLGHAKMREDLDVVKERIKGRPRPQRQQEDDRRGGYGGGYGGGHGGGFGGGRGGGRRGRGGNYGGGYRNNRY